MKPGTEITVRRWRWDSLLTIMIFSLGGMVGLFGANLFLRADMYQPPELLSQAELADRVFALLEDRCPQTPEEDGANDPDGPAVIKCKEDNQSLVYRAGEFISTDQGYQGTVETLAWSIPVQLHKLAPIEGYCPVYDVMKVTLRIGYAYRDCFEHDDRPFDSRPYITFVLDDPSFQHRIIGGLFAPDGGELGDNLILFWSRV